jgi:MFS family permease
MSIDPDEREPGMDGAAGPGPPVRRVLVFSIIALALMMMAVDGTIVATALDALQRGLGTTVNWAGWTITAYSFGFVLMLPVSGKLSAWYGNRKVFLGSVAAFTVASLCCGLVDNIYLLILLRALQAAGGAGFTPSATGIIVAHFGDARDRAVGLFGSIFPIGAIIGPIFGGLFVAYWSWRGIFLVNVPIGAAVIALALRYVPSDPPSTARSRLKMDFPGLALLGVALFTGMLAATNLGEPAVHPWSLSFVLPLFIAMAALWLFIRHIHRATQPFIVPRFIHGSGFGIVNLFNVLYGGAAAGVLVLIPLYAIDLYGMSALDSGTLLVARGVAAILFSTACAFALRFTGYRLPLYVGGILIAAGMLLLFLPAPGIPPYLWLAIGAFFTGIGAGMINPASRNAGLQLEPEKAPAIAAVRSMDMQVGRITTISIVTAILASVASPGHTQAWIFLAGAVVLLAALPIIPRVPEHRGAW